MDIILKGIGAGFALALLIGPVFFTLLQTSVERGFRSGAWVAVGVSLSDSMYILVCYLGLSTALANDRAQQYMGFIGGLILFSFGLYYLMVKSRRPVDFRSVNIKSTGPVRLIMKGFIINGLSPMVLLFWLGMVSVATGEFGYSSFKAVGFFGSVVATVFATDLLKAKMADKLRQVMTVHFVRLLNIMLGSGMILFAIRMFLIGGSINLP